MLFFALKGWNVFWQLAGFSLASSPNGIFQSKKSNERRRQGDMKTVIGAKHEEKKVGGIVLEKIQRQILGGMV